MEDALNFERFMNAIQRQGQQHVQDRNLAAGGGPRRNGQGRPPNQNQPRWPPPGPYFPQANYEYPPTHMPQHHLPPGAYDSWGLPDHPYNSGHFRHAGPQHWQQLPPAARANYQPPGNFVNKKKPVNSARKAEKSGGTARPAASTKSQTNDQPPHAAGAKSQSKSRKGHLLSPLQLADPRTYIQVQVNEIKEEGNDAHNNGRYDEAIQCYSEALALAQESLGQGDFYPVDDKIIAQLYSNRSLVLSRTGDNINALADAKQCIGHYPEWFKGHLRAVQLHRTLLQYREALDLAFEALMIIKTPKYARTDLLMELIAMIMQVHGHDEEDLLPSCEIDAQTWEEVFKRLASENKWHVIKTLLEEDLDNMKQCGKSVFLMELVKHCLQHPTAVEWGQKLAVELLQRKCDYPSDKDDTANTLTLLRSVLDLGLQSGSFLLLKYLLANCDKSPARKNQQDIDGNTLLHFVTMSENAHQEKYTIALQMLVNCNLDVTKKNKEGKKAIDYLDKSSAMYKLLLENEKKRLGVDMKEMKRLISDGDQQMKLRKFAKAIMAYEKALPFIENLDVPKRDSSLLLCKLSQAEFDQNKKTPALDHASAAVKKDATCFESQRHLAKVYESLDRYDEAADSLFAAFGILKKSGTERGIDDILFDLAIISPRVSGKSPAKYINRCVTKPTIWTGVVTRLSGRRAWEALNLVFLGGGNGHKKGVGGVATGCSAKKVYLSPIVPEYMNDVNGWKNWIEDLVVALISHGADSFRLSDHRSEHPMVLALEAGIATGSYKLLRTLFKYMAQPNDNMGRNLLHTLAINSNRKFIRTPELVDLVDLLIQNGVDPCKRDYGNYLPTDHTSPYSELYHILVRAMDKKRKQEEKAREDKLKEVATKLNTQPTSRSKKPREKCGKCSDDYMEALDLQDCDSWKALKLCIEIVKEKKHNVKEHDLWLRKSRSLIMKIMTRDREVPKYLASLDSREYAFFVHAAALDHWWLVEQLLDMYSTSHSTSGLTKDIELARFFGSTGNYHRSAPKRRYQALEKILEAGASVNNRSSSDNTLPLEAAVSGEDWGAIPLLIKYGASPEVLTFATGDTPLHVALNIAMVKDGGNFDVLRCLLDLHASDPDKYRYLHPSTQDRFGETLFHVAAQGQCTKHARKAVDFLFDSGVNPNLRNKAGKTALQCLQKKEDHRAHVIRMAGEKFSVPTKEKVGKAKKKKASQGIQIAQEQSAETGRKVETSEKQPQKGEKPDVVDVRVKNRVARCKDEIRQMLDILDVDLLADDTDSESDEEVERSTSYSTVSSRHVTPETDEVQENGGKDGEDDYQTCSDGEGDGKNEQQGRDGEEIDDITSGAARDDVEDIGVAQSREPSSEEARSGPDVEANEVNDPDSEAKPVHDADIEDVHEVGDADTQDTHEVSEPVCDADIEEHHDSDPDIEEPHEVGDPDLEVVPVSDPDIEEQHDVSDPDIEEPHEMDSPDLEVVPVSDPDVEERHDVSDPDIEERQDVSDPDIGEHHDISDPDIEERHGDSDPDIEERHGDSDPDIEERHGDSDPDIEERHGDSDPDIEEHQDVSDPDVEPEPVHEFSDPDMEPAHVSEPVYGAHVAQNGRQILNVSDPDIETASSHGSNSGDEFQEPENVRPVVSFLGANPDELGGTSDGFSPRLAEPWQAGQLTVLDGNANESGVKMKATESFAQDLDDTGETEAEEAPADVGEDEDGDADGEESDDDDDDEVEEEDADVTLDMLDEKVFNDLEWDMECTADVWKILCRKDLDFNMKALIIKKLKMLGSGNHQKHLCRQLRNVPRSILLYKAKLTKAARIIWEIAIAFSSRRSDLPNIRLGDDQAEVQTTGKIYAQVIRIWDIVFDHDKIYRSVQKIIGSHSKGEQCLIRKNLKGVKGKATDFWQDGKRLPMLFTEVEGMLGPLDPTDSRWARFFPPASSKETEYHIMKFYSFDASLVNNILHNHGEKLDFPFRVTELEHAIINLQPKPPSPVLLLGRSGTGKTTCCLYRLWTGFLRYWEKADRDSPILPRSVAFVSSPEEEDENSDDDGTDEENDESDEEEDIPPDDDENEEEVAEVIYEHLHQLFITKNPVLCSEVSKNFKLLSHAHTQVQAHVDVENEPVPLSLQLAHPCAFPLFLTSRQFLIMLDGSLPEPYFFSRNPDGTIEREIAGWGAEDGPLTFIPDLDDNDDEDAEEPGAEAAAEHDALVPEVQRQQHLDPRKEVTYEVFTYQLWSQMNKKQKAVCHPSLVWTEINSFIKGSMEALNSKKGYLEQEQYLKLGAKRAPNFSGNREQIYSLFKMYQVLIKQRGYFDEMDVIFNLYNRIKTMQKPEWALHQIFVDETQDFTQAELCLLIRCCQNPNDMFLTGDTAQSIMRGVAFRFSDLKSLFYYARESLKAMGKTQAVGIPRKVYQLTHNYRSHAGILNLASGIVDIMLHFFPESFDHLDKDQGLFDGPKPVLMECCDYSDLAMVLRGNKRETSQIEFGAHQAILVVNEKARDNLPEELSFGLVLTIYESKGLEFDDILLYNFFKDSQAQKEWCVVRNFLDELIDKHQTESHANKKGSSLADINIDVLNSTNRPRPLDFDPDKHKILNSELKHLYTAVTRARVNIWVFDEDEEARKPMFEYFRALNLVQSVEVSDDQDARRGMIELFSKSSSKQEWKEQGDQFFRQRLYGVAAKCYDKSGEKKLRQLSLAHQQALEASRIIDNKRMMREKFLFVALEYLKCERYLEAAKCLQNAREYEFAAILYEKLKEYGRAADMYERIKATEKRSRMLELGKNYGAAIDIHYRGERYDEAIAVLLRYKKTVQHYEKKLQPIPRELQHRKPDGKYTLRHLAMRSAEQHYKKVNKKRMMEALDYLTLDDAVNFLDAHQMKERAAELLRSNGKNVEAAHQLRNLGKIKEAMDCIVGYEDDSNVRSFLAQLKLAHARILFQTGNSEEVEELVKSAAPLFEKDQDYTKAAECRLLRACASSKKRYEYLQKSQNLFGEGSCTVGEVECAYQTVKLCPDKCTPKHCSAVLLRAIQKGLDLVAALLHQSGGSTVAAKESVKLCESFYGLRSSSSPEKREVVVSEGARIMQNIVLDDPKPVSLEMDTSDTHAMIAEEILDEKLSVLCKFVRDVFQKTRQSFMPCPHSRVGECPGAKALPGQEKCPYMHQRHTRDTFNRLVHATLPLIELDGYLATALDSKSLQDREKEKESIRRLSNEDVNQSCTELVAMFFPADRQESFMFGSVHQTLKTMQMLRNRVIIDHLFRYAEVKKEEFSKMSEYADILSADMFFSLLMIYMLCGKKQKIDEVMNRTSQAQVNLPHDVISAAFEWAPDPRSQDPRKKLPVNVFCNLLSMFNFLYESKNPVDAIGMGNKYFYLVAKRNDPLMIPSYTNTLMMLEYQLALSVSMYLRHSINQTHSFLPKSYLAHITFWDCAFNAGRKFSTFSCVQNYKVEPHYLKRLKGGLWSMWRVFNGFESSGFNMWEAFNPGSESCTNGEAERVLVFALTVFLNVNLMIPNNHHRYHYLVVENLLMQAIDELDLLNSPCPQRLKDAIEAVKAAKGHQDIARTLGKLLVQRGEEGLVRCVWKGDDNYGKPTVHCQKLENYETLLPGFYNFSHASLKESKSREAVREELKAGKVEPEMEQMPMPFIQTLPEEQVVTESSATGASPEGTQESQEEDDPDLRIDDTMCSTCGVRFSDVRRDADEMVDVQADDSGAAADSMGMTSDVTDATKHDHVQRRDHEASEEHKRKVEICKTFKEHLKRSTWPIQEKAKGLLELGHPRMPQEEFTMPKHEVEINLKALHEAVETVQSKRDWGNWEEVKEATRKLFESNNALIYKVQAWDKEEEAKMAQAGAARGNKAATPEFDPQDLEDEAIEKIVDEPEKKKNRRMKGKKK